MLKVSVSGIRGIVGEGFDPPMVVKYLTAFSKILLDGPIVIGRDSRPSGGAIKNLVSSVLRLLGRDVIDIGIQTTPTCEIAVKKLGAVGGVVITASHNPSEWNALKLLDADGMFLDEFGFDRLKKALTGDVKWANYDRIGFEKIIPDAYKLHIDSILSLRWIDVKKIKKARLKVAVDANGGTGGIAIIPLLERLNCRIFPIACEPDGNFVHDPEPKPSNLSTLSSIVKEKNMNIGFATDPDADRLAMVDENGNILSEEYTVAIGSAEVIEHEQGPIVVNLSTSSMIESLGRPVFRTPVGEINVAKKMLEVGSPVGGEGNGGLIVPACHPGRDASLAVAVVLNRMARTGNPLSQLASQFPQLKMVKDKIEFDGKIEDKIEDFKNIFQPVNIDLTDGIRLILREGWLHIRASNTEPSIRIIAEFPDEKSSLDAIEKAKGILSRCSIEKVDFKKG